MKTNLSAIFATDEKKEEGGAWIMVNEAYGLRIKVRRLRSDTVVKAYERILREELGEGKLRKPGDIDDAMSMHMFKRQLAEAVLVDWENVRDTETGEEVPFSVEAAMEAVAYKDFRDFVVQAANERDSFREDADKDAEGN